MNDTFFLLFRSKTKSPNSLSPVRFVRGHVLSIALTLSSIPPPNTPPSKKITQLAIQNIFHFLGYLFNTRIKKYGSKKSDFEKIDKFFF